MGTWGDGNFDNDGALDLIGRVVEHNSLEPAREAIDAILAVDDYIDVDYGEETIAAAEIIAMLRGNPSTSIPPSLSKWQYPKNLSVDETLVAKAILAVKKASQHPDSEFRELREEGEGLPGWYENIQDLLDRLS